MRDLEIQMHSALQRHGPMRASDLHRQVDPGEQFARNTIWAGLRRMLTRGQVLQDRHGVWSAVAANPNALDESSLRQLHRIYRALGNELTSIYASGVHITTAPRHFEDVLAGRFDRSADMGTLVRAVIAARTEAARVRAPSRDSGIRGVAA
jgi:predicted transcriptional regulator